VIVRHVLLDADGVVQQVPGDWYAAMEPYVGDRARDFLHETWKEELPMLAGRGDYLAHLAIHLRKYGVTTPVEDVYADVWHRIEVDSATVALVHRLRAAGYGVHLGTNQESYRGAYMRSVLGYDNLFDVSCYSYDLGVAKPAPEFFLEAARRIGADPGEIVFVDDWDRNVTAAASAGLSAVHWTFEHGHDALVARLAEFGVTV
jgi:putative hydrolase of the HAD superfamily